MANRIRRWAAERMLAVVCSVGFAVLGLALVVPLLFERETPVLRMSAGPDATRRHAVALYLSQEAEQNNLSIKLEATAGSEACLNLLKAGQLDAAIVSSGVKVPDDNEIQVLGALQLEAVHILVRKELAEAGPLSEAVRGKRVNVGEKGSTEWLLAQQILAFAGLRQQTASQVGDVVTSEYSRATLIDKARAILQADGAKKNALIAELPDCMLLLETMPSTVTSLLVKAADYRIVPLPATRAFLLDNMQDAHAQSTVVEREFLEPAVIPANSYFTTRGYPVSDCETVGVRILIVARKDVSSHAIRPLMKTIFEGEFCHRIQPQSPHDLATQYAIHPAALGYLDRNKTLLIEQAMEWFSKGLSFFGAFSAGALSLYSLLRRKKARKPADYFAEIRKLDQVLLSAAMDSNAPTQPKELGKHLDDRLLKLRQELIEDICDGSIKGDQSIANILALLKEARRGLPRLEGEAALAEDYARLADRPLAKAA